MVPTHNNLYLLTNFNLFHLSSFSAMLYGAIGSILGHELTHGFDNTGRKFNKHGELRKQWWTNSSLAAFTKRSQCMIDQYNKYKVRGLYQVSQSDYLVFA